MRSIALIAGILVLATGCDKQAREAASAADAVFTELDSNATLLFQVFGPAEAPRVAPIAVVRDGELEPLTQSEGGWRAFDAKFFAAGRDLTVYRNGVSAGTLEITRGMWPDNDAVLYSVPGCRRVVPHAMARLRPTIAMEETVELVASSVPIDQRIDIRPVPAGPESQGRTLSSAVATANGIGPEDLSGLDFHARWLRTGVGESGRTLLASHIDPNAGDLGPGAGNTSMVLVLAEDSSGTLNTSYQHAVSGEARTVEFQRLVNYADFDGDGVSELVLEAWRYGGIPNLVILKYSEGRWRETLRVSLDWCVDRR
jgi:hypothetical protein